MNKPDYDLNVSKGVKSEIAKFKIPLEYLCAIADMPLSTLNDKLAGKTPWRVKEVGLFADYFGVSLDIWVFNQTLDERKKVTEKQVKVQLKKYLIENKKYKSLGKLEANGYFKGIE